MKYKVLKDFTTPRNDKYKASRTFEFPESFDWTYKEWLLEDGYIEEAKEGRWKPEEGQVYWYVSPYSVAPYGWGGDSIDLWRWELGNVFLTKEDAEFEYERRKVETELKDLTNGFEPDWENEDEAKYYIYYNHEDRQVDYASHTNVQFTAINFSSKCDIENAIKTIGKDRLKKYYFRIKE